MELKIEKGEVTRIVASYDNYNITVTLRRVGNIVDGQAVIDRGDIVCRVTSTSAIRTLGAFFEDLAKCLERDDQKCVGQMIEKLASYSKWWCL
ncbi:MAG: hypothetical protein QXU93_05460 [Thermoproteus sp.]